MCVCFRCERTVCGDFDADKFRVPRESPWCMSDHQVWHHPQLHSRVAGDGSGQTPIIGLRYRIVTKQASEPGVRASPKRNTTDSQVDKTKKAIHIEHKDAKKQDKEQALTTKRSTLKAPRRSSMHPWRTLTAQAILRRCCHQRYAEA